MSSKNILNIGLPNLSVGEYLALFSLYLHEFLYNLTLPLLIQTLTYKYISLAYIFEICKTNM